MEMAFNNLSIHSAFINAETLRILDSSPTYCEAIRAHALQKRDSGHHYLRIIFIWITVHSFGLSGNL